MSASSDSVANADPALPAQAPFDSIILHTANALRQHTSAYSAYVSIRQHTSAYVSIRLQSSLKCIKMQTRLGDDDMPSAAPLASVFVLLY